MLVGKRVRSLVTAVFLARLTACSNADTDCTCAVENGGEQRTLACGQRACIGGTSLSCAEKNEIQRGGSCTATQPGAEPDAGGPADEPNPTNDQACADLASFCSTSCAAPPDAAADCQATASAGDPTACAGWQLASGVPCHP